MLQIVIVLAWLVALGLVVYLAKQAITRRWRGRRQRKISARNLREFRKHHHFDTIRRQWVRNVDQVAVVDEASEDRRLILAILGWLLFFLWEGYWFSEVIERYSTTSRPLQLPYVFLFVMLVVVPLAVNMFFWRKMRR